MSDLKLIHNTLTATQRTLERIERRLPVPPTEPPADSPSDSVRDSAREIAERCWDDSYARCSTGKAAQVALTAANEALAACRAEDDGKIANLEHTILALNAAEETQGGGGMKLLLFLSIPLNKRYRETKAQLFELLKKLKEAAE